MRIGLLVLMATLIVVGCQGEPETLEELTAAGRKAFGESDYHKSRMYFSQAVLQDASNREILYLLGVSYMKEQMWDSATHFLKRVDILHPKDRETNLNLYESAVRAEDHEIAREALRTIIETGDPEEMYLEDLANLSVQMEDYIWANYYARKLLDLQPDKPNSYVYAANTAAEVGSLSVSMEIINGAIEEFGPKPEFLANKGLFFAAQGKHVESEKVFRQLIALDSTVGNYRVNLAHSLASQDDPAKKREALDIYVKIREHYPDPTGLDSVVTRLRTDLGLE